MGVGFSQHELLKCDVLSCGFSAHALCTGICLLVLSFCPPPRERLRTTRHHSLLPLELPSASSSYGLSRSFSSVGKHVGAGRHLAQFLSETNWNPLDVLTYTMPRSLRVINYGHFPCQCTGNCSFFIHKHFGENPER